MPDDKPRTSFARLARVSEFVHTFAGNPLERGEALRRDEATIEDLAAKPKAKFLPFVDLKVCCDAAGGLGWITAADVESLDVQESVFLGVDDQEAPLFAVSLAQDSPPPRGDFQDCRLIAAQLAVADTGILAQARAQLDWHHRNPFCARCGHPSVAERGGHIRRCTSCKRHVFPRTDPVAIMLIVDARGGDRCLLGQPQGRIANTTFYTALAGFLDQGESLEAAVRREVWEEAGVRVGHVQYHSSQPWPFPSQLMIGCHGVADSTTINMDPVEMADVKWFTKNEVSAALTEENPKLRVPGAMAIAHHLIRSWVEGEVTL